MKKYPHSILIPVWGRGSVSEQATSAQYMHVKLAHVLSLEPHTPLPATFRSLARKFLHKHLSLHTPCPKPFPALCLHKCSTWSLGSNHGRPGGSLPLSPALVLTLSPDQLCPICPALLIYPADAVSVILMKHSSDLILSFIPEPSVAPSCL